MALNPSALPPPARSQNRAPEFFFLKKNWCARLASGESRELLASYVRKAATNHKACRDEREMCKIERGKRNKATVACSADLFDERCRNGRFYGSGKESRDFRLTSGQTFVHYQAIPADLDPVGLQSATPDRNREGRSEKRK